jgi:hypothetical protein
MIKTRLELYNKLKSLNNDKDRRQFLLNCIYSHKQLITDEPDLESQSQILKGNDKRIALCKKVIEGEKKKITFTDNECELYIRQKNKAKFKTPEEEYEYAVQKEKECSKCRLMKKLTEYTGNTSGCDAFDKEGYRLRRPECKDCTIKTNKGKNEAIKLAKNLRIAYKAPEGTICALCGKLPKKGDGIVFDHCHKTNTFRGYLHNSCNRALGVLGDDVTKMIKCINYMNIHEKKNITQNKDTGDLEIIED